MTCRYVIGRLWLFIQKKDKNSGGRQTNQTDLDVVGYSLKRCLLYFVCCLLSCFCACLVWCWLNRSFWRLLSGGHDNQYIYCQGLFNTAVSCLLSVVSCIVSALVLSGVDSEGSSAGAGRQTRQIRLLCRSSMQQGVNKMHSDKSIKQSKRRNNTFDKSHVIALTIWVFCENKEYVIDANFQSLVWY